jgi:hypothetical protein
MTAIKISRQAGSRVRGADIALQQKSLSRSRDDTEWLGCIYDKRGGATILNLPRRVVSILTTEHDNCRRFHGLLETPSDRHDRSRGEELNLSRSGVSRPNPSWMGVSAEPIAQGTGR